MVKGTRINARGVEAIQASLGCGCTFASINEEEYINTDAWEYSDAYSDGFDSWGAYFPMEGLSKPTVEMEFTTYDVNEPKLAITFSMSANKGDTERVMLVDQETIWLDIQTAKELFSTGLMKILEMEKRMMKK